MTFDEMTRAAARNAGKAVDESMRTYKRGEVTDEDDLTGHLLGSLQSAFNRKIAGLKWSASILRHRSGAAAEEKRVGADMLVHVKLKTNLQTYSKGVLIQAKRIEPSTPMVDREFSTLKSQCRKMLKHSPSSFVFLYAKGSMRCTSATKVYGSEDRQLYNSSEWTSYRFFLELFRCPIGDQRITSAQVSKLPVPVALEIAGAGELSDSDILG